VLLLKCLVSWYRREFQRGTAARLAWLCSFNDDVLGATRNNLAVDVRNANAAYVHLFFKNEPLFDDEDLFYNRNNRDFPLFANRRHAIDRPTDCDMLDLDPLM
jgi:hypothetical protein